VGNMLVTAYDISYFFTSPNLSFVQKFTVRIIVVCWR
jgi:hypothetical protein